MFVLQWETPLSLKPSRSVTLDGQADESKPGEGSGGRREGDPCTLQDPSENCNRKGRRWDEDRKELRRERGPRQMKYRTKRTIEESGRGGAEIRCASIILVNPAGLTESSTTWRTFFSESGARSASEAEEKWWTAARWNGVFPDSTWTTCSWATRRVV